MGDPPPPLRWLTRRFAWAATTWRVHTRTAEVHGGQLAAAITLSSFTALFPLLLALIGIAGFVSAGRADFADDVISRLGITGTAAETVTDALSSAERTRVSASVLGLAGLLWSGLSLVAALEASLNAVWQVGGRGIKGKVVALLWLLGAGLILATSIALTALTNVLPIGAGPVTFGLGIGVNALLWFWTFRTLTNRPLPWRAHLPGTVLGAIGLQILTALGTIYVPRAVASSSALYGSLGVILAVLAWLLFFGRLVVYAAALNVVRWEEEHGTVTVELEIPRMPGSAPTGASRSGEEVA